MNTSPQLPLSRGFSVFLCILLSAVILAVPLLFWLRPVPDYSEAENRMLTSTPSFTADSLFSGDYTKGLSAYLQDRLPLRSTLLSVKSAAEYGALRQENNRIMTAQGGYLVKRFEYSDQNLSTFRQNIAAIDGLIQALKKHQKPAVFVCAPRAVDVLIDRCPAFVEEPTERSVWQILKQSDTQAITFTDLLREKAKAGESVWYRTDHHWTTLGAYYAYTALGAPLGYRPLPREAFAEQTICKDFYGTSHAAAAIPICRADTVRAMRYQGDETFVCTDRITGKTENGLYRPEMLNARDKYQYFLGGNTAHLHIAKAPSSPRPTLLIIKDSYAQSAVPFLARHFDIELIDLRYFRGDATEVIHDIVNSPNYAGTLVLYNADTLTGEAGLTHISTEKL